MNDVIPKPGLYRQQNGKQADVKWVGDGKALGFDSSGEGTTWDADSGRWVLCDDCEHFWGNITGPWIPEPTAGFVVQDRKTYRYAIGDRHVRLGFSRSWVRFEANCHMGLTAVELDAKYPQEAPFYIASPIPKPTVDPGEGWRLLGDEEVICNGDQFLGPKSGLWLEVSSVVGDTVSDARKMLECVGFRRRVTPVAQSEWVPTNELRWGSISDFNHDSIVIDQRWLLIQKWTCGEKSEWRAIDVHF